MRPIRRRAALAVLFAILSCTALVGACQIVDGLGSVVFVDGSTEDSGAGSGTVDGPCSIDAIVNPTPGVTVNVPAAGHTTRQICVDGTEVTFGQFTQFIQDAGLPESGLCKGLDHGDFTSTASCETPSDFPVTLVPWCGADWYCSAHGGGLCTPGDWAEACRGPASTSFPYGDSFMSGACNVASSGPGPVPWDGGSCQGGYEGLYDLIGNVAEWTSTCGGKEMCGVIGGGYEAGMMPCLAAGFEGLPDGSLVPATSRDRWIGFRCCHDGGCPP